MASKRTCANWSWRERSFLEPVLIQVLHRTAEVLLDPPAFIRAKFPKEPLREPLHTVKGVGDKVNLG